MVVGEWWKDWAFRVRDGDERRLIITYPVKKCQSIGFNVSVG